MAIGRTFKEAFQKGAARARDGARRAGRSAARCVDDRLPDDIDRGAARRAAPADAGADLPGQARASQRGMSPSTSCYELTAIDPWFLSQMQELVEAERWYRGARRRSTPTTLRRMKRMGFSDRQLADAARRDRRRRCARARWSLGVRPAYKMVDTCAGEFPSATPYLYSSYDEESEAPRSGRESVVILGSGPNRIGQGVEFDYCCVRAVMALREQGYETIMINSNPETVSTDFDISDKLYFEPLTLEDVLEIVRSRAADGRHRAARRADAAQAHARARGGGRAASSAPRPTRSTPPRTAGASRRSRASSGSTQPPNGTATSVEEAVEVGGADRLSGARAAVVRARRARDADRVRRSRRCEDYFAHAVRVSRGPAGADRPLPRGRLRGRRRRASRDGESVVIGGVMQHIEDAGIHSGDSACVLPPYLIGEKDLQTMREHTVALAKALGVVGLINVQYADQGRRGLRARGEPARQPHHSRSSRRRSACRSRRSRRA